MSNGLGKLRFYSAVRRGAVLGIQREDVPFPDPDEIPPAEPRVTVNIKLKYATNHSAILEKVSFVSPGDIVGLDSRSIVRAYPRPDENNAESGFLVHLEFDQADLLWRYTPAAMSGLPADRDDRIRPWLSLLVLSETDKEFTYDDHLSADGKQKLPKLTVTSPGVLPDPRYAWAWSHVQVAGLPATTTALVTLMDGTPGPVVARLLCPRKLEGSKAYRAFLVPTFKRGSLVGLGESLNTAQDGLETAWSHEQTANVTLPVYYSWRFQTGMVASFEEAVEALQPEGEQPATVGTRQLDVSAPGGTEWPSPVESGRVSLGGALQTTAQAGSGTDPTLKSDWLDELVDQTDETQVGDAPTLGPPLYGRWYAAAKKLLIDTNKIPWFYALNADPRWRVAAGLGTEVVLRDQQALMLAAWGQAERLVMMNRQRRVMQAGREVMDRLLTRFVFVGGKGRQVAMTQPIWSLVPQGQGTVWRTIKPSPLWGLLGPWWRRLVSPQGPIGNRNPGLGTNLDGVVDAVNKGTFPGPRPELAGITPSPRGDTPAGTDKGQVDKVTRTLDASERVFWGMVVFWTARDLLVTEGGRYWWLLRKLMRFGLQLARMGSSIGKNAAVGAAQRMPGGLPTTSEVQNVGPVANGAPPFTEQVDLSNPTSWPEARQPAAPGDVENDAWAGFRQGVLNLIEEWSKAPSPGPTQTIVDLSAIITALKNGLNPHTTFAAVAKARHKVADSVSWESEDVLEPVLVPPKLDRPMWRELRDLSPEWILPGIGTVPRNTVSLLKTNRKFIEAFMVGLNHEMTRELVWHGYPTDQRGTYFGQFWDFRGWVKGSDEADRDDAAFVDIQSIATWGKQSELGSHGVADPGLVLLVRGDVIRRYPNVMVYASKADGTLVSPSFADTQPQRHPVFQSFVTADIAIYGFELTNDQVVGKDGGAGWYFVLQEHPSEPRFEKLGSGSGGNVEAKDYGQVVEDGTDITAALVAKNGYDQPARVAIHGSSLLPSGT